MLNLGPKQELSIQPWGVNEVGGQSMNHFILRNSFGIWQVFRLLIRYDSKSAVYFYEMGSVYLERCLGFSAVSFLLCETID